MFSEVVLFLDGIQGATSLLDTLELKVRVRRLCVDRACCLFFRDFHLSCGSSHDPQYEPVPVTCTRCHSGY